MPRIARKFEVYSVFTFLFFFCHDYVLRSNFPILLCCYLAFSQRPAAAGYWRGWKSPAHWFPRVMTAACAITNARSSYPAIRLRMGSLTSDSATSSSIASATASPPQNGTEHCTSIAMKSGAPNFFQANRTCSRGFRNLGRYEIRAAFKLSVLDPATGAIR